MYTISWYCFIYDYFSNKQPKYRTVSSGVAKVGHAGASMYIATLPTSSCAQLNYLTILKYRLNLNDLTTFKPTQSY